MSDERNDRKSQLATINEACEYLGCSRPTIYKLIKSGKLAAVSLASQQRIPWEDLEGYIDANRIQIESA